MITRGMFIALFLGAGCTAPLTVAEPRDAGAPINAPGADADPPLVGEDAAAADAGLDANEEPDPLSDPVDAEADG